MQLVTSLLLLAAVAAPMPVEVQTLDGQTHRGTLVELGERRLTLSVKGKPVSLPIAELQQLRPQSPPKPAGTKSAAWVELTDGSQLATDDFAVDRGTAQLSSGGEQIRVTTNQVRSVRFKEESAAQAAEWSRIRALDAGAD